MTLTEQLARFFREHAGEWLGARQLEFAGRQAWRTRVSDLRKPPYGMTIENEVKRIKTDQGEIRMSRYRYQP